MSSASQYNVFHLPKELLDTFTLRDAVQEIVRPPTPSANVAPAPASGSGTRACHICLGANFSDVEDQRTHHRSDWHRYNVKIRLTGGNPVSESAFVQLVDAMEDSLSGSASSSEESESDSDKIATLLDKYKRIARSPSPSDKPTMPHSPLAWFNSAPCTQVGVYKVLFPIGIPPASMVDELRTMQQSTQEGRKWAMFMTAGGHFAGAIVRVSQAEDDQEEDGASSKKHKPKRPKPETEVLKHKTFHRYTTRRKQGGSQSMNDNAKGPAKSAGAQLRRYGEQALRDDIRSLLQDWADDIEDCERIWIRASVSNRRIFLGYDDAVIDKADPRLRTFPFPTRRPTQSELSRCLLELTRAKVTHFTEEELRVQDEAYIASLPKPKPQPTPAPIEAEKHKQPKLSKEEEQLRVKWARLLEMVSKGRLEPLRAFWAREETSLGGINVALPDWTGEKAGTLLQLASQAGAEEVTQWLLEDQHADPTIEVPLRGANAEKDDTNDDSGHASDTLNVPTRVAGSRRTAYDIARNKEVRNIFRRCAAAHPDWWDWLGAARVPSALSPAMEEEREEKQKIRRKGLKERIKEREARARDQAKERSPSPPPVTPDRRPLDPSAPRKLGGSAGSAEGIAGLSPEMRAKVERERRARAAEARLKALAGH